MHIVTPIVPRLSDTDLGGHINNTAVAQWLEMGRTDFYLNHHPAVPAVMLRRLELEYDREMRYQQPAEVRTGVIRIGNTSLTLRQEVWQGDQCCARAVAVDCFFDPAIRRPAPMSGQQRELYEKLSFEQ